MIEGVIRDCTEMEVDRQYVDSHGQSTVAFAFCRLLGFQLMPRLKAIHAQKLYRPEAGQPDAYTNLQLLLTKLIDWELVRQQYDQMVKYATALRREINEGLNVIEQWNGANDFVFFARRGELVSNRNEDHEVSMLALHLLQNCMVYVNTLMLQQVLAQPKWADKLTPRDLRALTPLIWDHVNPYGRFELDMNARLPLN